jgi:hypothetical protein
MRWVLQTPRIWEQETTQPNRPKQTKISPVQTRWCLLDFQWVTFHMDEVGYPENLDLQC